jgi:hypothetical protein
MFLTLFAFRQVPLDYSNPDAASAAIAMIRKHSVVPHNSTEYRGPILINPGGPGGSGVDMITVFGAQLSTIVGPEFDFIGFDPRGGSLSKFRQSAKILAKVLPVPRLVSRPSKLGWSESSGPALTTF